MLDLSVNIGPEPVFLYPVNPSRTLVHPQEGEGGANANDGEPPADETIIQGEVVANADIGMRVGPMRVLWEVAMEQRDENGEWGERTPLHTIALDTPEEDRWLKEGRHKFYFTLKLPATLPPLRWTCFERVIHTLFVSIVEPAPDYYYIPPPSPQLRPSTPDDHQSSRRSVASLGSPPSARSIHFQDADTGRKPSLLKSLFGAGSRKDSRVSLADSAGSGSGVERAPSETSGGAGGTGGYHQVCTGWEVGLPEFVNFEPRLPEVCQPAMASVTKCVEVTALHDSRGELRRVHWARSSDVPGLGHMQSHVLSDLFLLGAGFNFRFILTDIDQRTTVHSIAISLIQRTVSADKQLQDVDTFRLYRCGLPYRLLDKDSQSPFTGDYVWRGEVARTLDGQLAAKKSKKKHRGPVVAEPVPQADVPNVKAYPERLYLSVKPRLPSNVIGGQPTSPPTSFKGLSRTDHRLRLEVFYSVLGEDGDGIALPAVNGRPPEGGMRRLWIDHSVALGDCMSSPTNILAPTYTASPSKQDDRPDYTCPVEQGKEPPAFKIPRTHVRIHKDGREVPRARLPQDAIAARLRAHQEIGEGRCLCFYGTDRLVFAVGEMEPDQPGLEGEGDGELASAEADGAISMKTKTRAITAIESV